MTLSRVIASVCGLGRFPWAPGTLTSIVAALAAAPMLDVSPWLLLAAALMATLLGVWAIDATGVAARDPTWIVIDEVAGQWITLLALPRATLPAFAAGVVLFRALDVAKPGPIGWADRQTGAVAVMGDDVIAGMIGAAVLLGFRLAWPGALD